MNSRRLLALFLLIAPLQARPLATMEGRVRIKPPSTRPIIDTPSFHRVIESLFESYEQEDAPGFLRFVDSRFQGQDATGNSLSIALLPRSLGEDFRRLDDIHHTLFIEPPRVDPEAQRAWIEVRWNRRAILSGGQNQEWLVRDQESVLVFSFQPANRDYRLIAVEGAPLFGLTSRLGVLTIRDGTLEGKAVPPEGIEITDLGEAVPVIDSITPGRFPRGATNVPVVVRGRNFFDGDGFRVLLSTPSMPIPPMSVLNTGESLGDGSEVITPTEVRFTIGVVDIPSGEYLLVAVNPDGAVGHSSQVITIEPVPVRTGMFQGNIVNETIPPFRSWDFETGSEQVAPAASEDMIFLDDPGPPGSVLNGPVFSIRNTQILELGPGSLEDVTGVPDGGYQGDLVDAIGTNPPNYPGRIFAIMTGEGRFGVFEIVDIQIGTSTPTVMIRYRLQPTVGVPVF